MLRIDALRSGCQLARGPRCTNFFENLVLVPPGKPTGKPAGARPGESVRHSWNTKPVSHSRQRMPPRMAMCASRKCNGHWPAIGVRKLDLCQWGAFISSCMGPLFQPTPPQEHAQGRRVMRRKRPTGSICPCLAARCLSIDIDFVRADSCHFGSRRGEPGSSGDWSVKDYFLAPVL
jgi:hypothetical protein